MVQDNREFPVPPEADAIRLARLSGRLSVDEVVARVRQAGGKLSGTYLRDIERGHGGRRGQRVPARVSEGLLAQIADVVGVTPGQLRDAAREHPDGEERARVVLKAARVLEAMRRRAKPAQPGFRWLPDAAGPFEKDDDMERATPFATAILRRLLALETQGAGRPTGRQLAAMDADDILATYAEPLMAGWNAALGLPPDEALWYVARALADIGDLRGPEGASQRAGSRA